MKNNIQVLWLAGLLMLPVFGAKAQSKYGADSAACVQNLSLYRDDYNKKKYDDAYPNWRSVVESCPKASKNTFVHGPVILEYKIKNAKAAKDTAAYNSFIQELIDLFELRAKCYPEDEGYCLGQIGFYTMKYRGAQYEKAYEDLKKSVAMCGSSTPPAVLNMYIQTAERYMKNKRLDADVVLNAYDEITEVLDDVLDKSEQDFNSVMQQIYILREQLDSANRGEIDSTEMNQAIFEVKYEDLQKDSVKTYKNYSNYTKVAHNIDVVVSKYATCDKLDTIYGKKLAQSSDERLLRQVIKLYNKKNCTSPIYAKAIKELHKIAPTANTAYYMGAISLQNGSYSEAETYLKEALSLYEKESDIIKTYLMLGGTYRQMKQYSQARECAYKILKMNPTNGPAYILIGDLYAYSGCATDVPGAANWAAADKYSKAMAVAAVTKDVDEKQQKVYDEAQQKLSQAAARFPKAETYFQRGLQKGQSFRVECWINETTVVR
ncbi:MAG: tetratricopeptide repeat protein [Bacteroidales bacterium]|nr:tetratricopeptide repeat protein [Bacteroidales bacterium]